MLSGTAQSPIVSLFRTRGVPLQQLSDVIIHCDGKHFTLLRPAAQLVDGETEADAGHASVVPGSGPRASRATGSLHKWAHAAHA